MKLRSTKGFSLVELIIVIAILGIIAVIAIPNLVGIQKRSQVNADIRSAESIARALSTLVAEDRTAVVGGSAKSVNTLLGEKWHELSDLKTNLGIEAGEYVELSLKPQAQDGVSYYVKYLGSPKRVVVAVFLENKDKITETFDTILYNGEIASAGGKPMIACINGLEADATNIGNYDDVDSGT